MAKKKKKESWVDKLKKKVKEYFEKERQENQDRRDRSTGRRLKKGGLSDEDIKRMGYAPKKKEKKN